MKVDEAHDLADRIEKQIRKDHDITTTIHIEPAK